VIAVFPEAAISPSFGQSAALSSPEQQSFLAVDAEILIAVIRNAEAGLRWKPKYSIESMIEHAWEALQPASPKAKLF
jgi:hypothetical protein